MNYFKILFFYVFLYMMVIEKVGIGVVCIKFEVRVSEENSG